MTLSSKVQMKIIKADTKRFSNWELPIMEHGKPTKYGWMVHHPENLKLSRFTDIGMSLEDWWSKYDEGNPITYNINSLGLRSNLEFEDLVPNEFIPVFPPIELSTCASKVVGMCIIFVPRLTIEVANPLKSPITPPPKLIT